MPKLLGATTSYNQSAVRPSKIMQQHVTIIFTPPPPPKISAGCGQRLRPVSHLQQNKQDSIKRNAQKSNQFVFVYVPFPTAVGMIEYQRWSCADFALAIWYSHVQNFFK